MTFAVEIRRQIMELCKRLEIPVQTNQGNTDVVRRALAEGLFTNVARLSREGHYITVSMMIVKSRLLVCDTVIPL